MPNTVFKRTKKVFNVGSGSASEGKFVCVAMSEGCISSMWLSLGNVTEQKQFLGPLIDLFRDKLFEGAYYSAQITQRCAI